MADHWPTSSEIYLPGGAVPRTGALFHNPALAQMYRRLLDEATAPGRSREDVIEAARATWAEGFVAGAIDDFCRNTAVMDSTGRAHRGFLSGDDMARWRAHREDPVEGTFRGLTVCKTGPWGQGPVFLQQLALLAEDDLAALDPMGAPFIHLVTEAAKLAFADREAFYGDPEAVDVPIDALLSPDYARARRRLITEDASHDHRPGAPGGRTPYLGAFDRIGPGPGDAEIGGGEPTKATADLPPGDTCHLDVVDRWGNMVSATPSGGWLQSSPVIPALGFGLTTRAQMFWLDPASPSALAPGRRPRTTLTPTLVLRGGEPTLAFGTPGGDGQDQWSFTFFLRHVLHRLNLQAAIDAPAFYTEHFPSSFHPRLCRPGHLAVEGRISDATIDALTARGHKVERGGDWAYGRLAAVGRDRSEAGPILKAGANARLMQGYAIGR